MMICIILWKVRFFSFDLEHEIGVGAKAISTETEENHFHFTESCAQLVPLMWVSWQWN